MSNEIWKDIEGFPGYQVSDRGRVRSFRNYHGQITEQSRIIKPRVNKDGYYELTIYTIDRRKVTKRVHRLVANAFLDEHPNLVVNHINGVKTDNSVSNLEFVTAKQNSTLASEMGLYKTKSVRIIETGEVFDSIANCAESINGDSASISNCLNGRMKTHRGLSFEYADYNEKKENKKLQFLYDYQMDAVNRMRNGCILAGGVGSGKSRTGLYYYFKENGGSFVDQEYIPMKNPQDLYIITTAMKRDTHEWDSEIANYRLSTDPDKNELYDNKIIIDSWNNIKKYSDVKDSFFIFDEDRVTGSGTWVKAFLKIARLNDWIILSATSGDTWQDYIPVFIANGFYKNKTEFSREHIVYSRFTKYPQIERYINTGRLIRLRNKILIDMDFEKYTKRHHEDVYVKYDISKYRDAMRNRWNPFKDEPIQQASQLCYILRRIVNEDESRIVALMEILEKTPRAIIFYNFDYEREMLLHLFSEDEYIGYEVAEWSGHAHMPVPDTKRWIYLVQYTAGCEGWNCILTDTIIFFSQNYSYKVMEQACGRIDRLNTLSYSHGYCPVRLYDCVRLNYERAGLIDIKAKVTKQSIECTPGCKVTETAVFTTNLWR